MEHHMDTVPSENVANNKVETFSAQFSLRRDASKPMVMFIGQDKAFKQFSFLLKMWTGPKGKRPLLPEDVGRVGVIISLFICRAYDLIQELDQTVLDLVNEIRQGAR